ncbi:Phosphohydrolase (MutT/nudix family protein) [Alloactinosynnema sp. L-07]|uniref:MSMEG_1061 family FMN-dependent PPOX-type flavoprotein n=1 Tax=Alloactinosynnema sp. L-07 TaxID=1653480 RepID=UPI00065EF08F|nr:MSMEG_1061 family FMN-dependent PPOX-type flavoprotein [Alloactinosynnema sp. L-07]CRK61112.1 Phosphohydrolase (MutT/nudix family protein) [Alloactinosynnema sp. L-07]
MTNDLFADAITSEEELRAIYEPPAPLAQRKEIQSIDEMARALIACSPLVFLASADADGRCDVTPRGGPAGFVSVLEDGTIVIPDATGNRRIDTLRNVVRTGRIGLIFVIPGRGQSLRVNGRACVSASKDLLERVTHVGKAPRSALVVEADEVYAHCPKAFVRSGVWKPETWLPSDAQPHPAKVSHAHIGDPSISVEQIEQDQRDSLLYRLA